jgi:hypothetical protein
MCGFSEKEKMWGEGGAVRSGGNPGGRGGLFVLSKYAGLLHSGGWGVFLFEGGFGGLEKGIGSLWHGVSQHPWASRNCALIG